MGGYGSGRSGGRPTVEGCPFVLDINHLRGNGSLVPEATCGSQITWSGEDDEVRLTVALQAHLAQHIGTLNLAYEHVDYWTGRARAEREGRWAATEAGDPAGDPRSRPVPSCSTS